MGVIYKLKPTIKEYILKKKKEEPNLSCRRISSLVLEKFQLKLCKSSVNSLIKEASLSMPVGRRPKKRRSIAEAEGLGTMLLKAADYLLRGTYYISEAIKNRLDYNHSDLLAKTEALLYLPLFERAAVSALRPDYGLWPLINQQFSQEELSSFLGQLQAIKPLGLDVFRVISSVSEETRCIKIGLSDGNALYLDGQLHTTWSTPQIPYNFSMPLYTLKSQLNGYFQENRPLVLFMAPGYDTATREFFDLILSLEAKEKRIESLTLYNNKLEEIETLRLEELKKSFFVFGLWPWQFGEYRNIKTMGDFKPFYLELLKEDFYIAKVELELLRPELNKKVVLSGCALKTSLNQRIRLFILTNLSYPETSLEELAKLYLNRWPNLEETFQDFSRKIELFTYTAASQNFFSTQSLSLTKEASQDIKALLGDYLKVLDLYVRWHFFPYGYEDKDFATMYKFFYNLRAKTKKQKNCLLVTLRPHSGFPFLKDLSYACQRINEREIIFGPGLRLWLRLE